MENEIEFLIDKTIQLIRLEDNSRNNAIAITKLEEAKLWRQKDEVIELRLQVKNLEDQIQYGE